MTSMHTLPGGGAAEDHTHDGTDIDAGTVAIARLPTGTTGSTVALGNHVHAGADISSGTLNIARIPTGTSGSTVALGDHTHSAGAWNDVTLGASVNHGSTTNVSVRLESSSSVVRIRGRLVAAADRASSDTLATIPVGFRPPWEIRTATRTLVANVTNNIVTISTSGQITWGTTLSTNGELPLDGITWPVS